MVRTLGWCGAILLGTALVGCGSDSTGTRVIESPDKEALTDLGRGLKMLADDKKRLPAKLADLEPVEPMFPVAGPAIRNGEIVYLWGAGLAEGGNKILGYAKKTPAEGGAVLVQDGTVRDMTAAEFALAPKAR